MSNPPKKKTTPESAEGSGQRSGHGSKYARRKEAAIEALLTQRNVEEAGRTAGVGKQTLLRWLKIPGFRAELLEARRTAVSQTNGRLQQASGLAASTLLKIMLDGNASDSARVRAAEAVLDRANQAIESEDVLDRLGAVERAAGLPSQTANPETREGGS